MSTNNIYPPISLLVPTDKIPPSLGLISEGIESVLRKIHYKDYYVEKSALGDIANYNLSLVSNKLVGIDIPFVEGMRLVLNPSQVEDGESYTEIPVSLGYQLEIIKYIHGLNPQGFAANPLAYVHCLFELLEISLSEILYATLNEFVDSEDPLQTFIDTVNAKYVPDNPIIKNSGADINVYADVTIQIEENELSVLTIIFELYISNSDLNESLTTIKKLFRNWYDSFEIEDIIKKLLIPKINASINDITLALEFPERYLKPINIETGEPYKEGEVGYGSKSQLRFTVGTLAFSSETGLDFIEQRSFSFNTSEILNTGLTIGFQNAKIDLRKDRTIPEAIAAGYPNDFVGVFIEEATIGLPKQWGQDPNSSAHIIGRNLLIGTGGFSGTVGMEAISEGDPSPLLQANFGKLKISLDAFALTFKQNAITESNIHGTLVIPGFKDANNNDAQIHIDISFDAEGNFEISAFETDGIVLKFGDIFTYTIQELTVGRYEERFYLETSGRLKLTHASISNVIKEEFVLQNLRIWDDGKIEIQGGTLPLPEGFKIKFGPAEIFITAIHFGSIQKEYGGAMRKYNYWGFDGGVNLDPGGVDARGTGIKFCYTVDSGDFDSYISIDSIHIDLIIPGKAKPEDATLLISGWLAISRETFNIGDGETIDVQTYAGGIDLILPKAKLAASADMKFAPDVPAFIIDLGLELPSPIPLGPTGMGIYGFRGLFGHHYVASREAVGLTSENKWFDYYKAKPEEGVHVQKFAPPFSPSGKASGFSAGAGVSLATASDSGRAFSSKIFLLLSLPDLFMLEGKATILSERVGLTSSDPPFFAYVAISKKEIETGFGVSFKIPKDSGRVISLYAEMNAAFYFHNPKAWYIHLGTREKPNVARIFDILNAESFLMLSASGMEVGAKAVLEFKRSYLGGSLSADVGAYLETGGKISFERFQIGAYMATGGHVDVRVCGFGFFIYFDTNLAAELPKPFIIEGSVNLAVGFRILGRQIKKEFTVEFRWEKSQEKLISYISPIGLTASGELPAKAINMLSQETFEVQYITASTTASSISKLIPCDSYIDIEFIKPVNPTAVMDTIGGAAQEDSTAYIEKVPPKSINIGAEHNYSVTEVRIEYWDGTWKEYNPYQAIAPPVQSSNTKINFNNGDLKQIGQWQLQSAKEYNRLRILSQSVFSYMDNGLEGWVNPEQYGITPRSIFCVDLLLENEYVNWTDFEIGAKVKTGSLASKNNTEQKLRYRVQNTNGVVYPLQNNYGISKSLYIPNAGKLSVQLLERSAFVGIKLFTFSQNVTISYYQLERIDGTLHYNKISEVLKSRYETFVPIEYEDADNPIDFFVIEPAQIDKSAHIQLLKEIQALKENLYESNNANRPTILAQIQAKLDALRAIQKVANDGDTLDEVEVTNRKNFFMQLLQTLQSQREQVLSDIERYTSLYETAKMKMDSCCITLQPVSGQTATEICIDNLEDIIPEGTSIEDVENEYANFMTSLGILSVGVSNCKASYNINVAQLCNDAHTYLDTLVQKKKQAQKQANELDIHIAKTLENIQNLDDLLDSGLTIPPYSGDIPDSTVIHQIEWMSLQDYTFNTGVSGRDAVEKSYQDTVQAIQNNLSPIWRPNTTFRIKVKVKDNITNLKKFIIDEEIQNGKEYTYYFGFKTGGPVGFFHEDYDNANPNNKYAKPEPNVIPTTINLQKYKLTTLRNYIDYERSYPYATGNLINAKPLYYQNTELNLYYIKSYVYHLLNGWQPLGSLPAITGMLEVVVKDPLEEIEIPNPPPADIETKYFPQSIIGWSPDNSARIPKSIKIWDIMRNPELYKPDFVNNRGKCWSDGAHRIKPASLKTTVSLNFLRPRTLYTAIFYNNFNGNRREVHRYVFQTSQYASMHEQLGSYIMRDEKGNEKLAIYTINTSLDTTKENMVKSLIVNHKSGNSTLDASFTNPFDCLIEGVLGLSPLAPAENTEFNIIKNIHPITKAEKILGIIVRSPEPMLNPKMPEEIKQKSCVLIQMNLPPYSVHTHKSLFSKDCSQFYITDTTGYKITSNDIRFRFYSYKWDGADYVKEQDENSNYLKFETNVLPIN